MTTSDPRAEEYCSVPRLRASRGNRRDFAGFVMRTLEFEGDHLDADEVVVGLRVAPRTLMKH